MNGDTVIAKEIERTISSELQRIALLYRVFFRIKTQESLQKKLDRDPKKYSVDGKKIQDAFGFRVTVYFSDDIHLVKSLITSVFDVIEETVDLTEDSHFGATRCNIICSLPRIDSPSEILTFDERIDNTFEIQLRTVLSEGWHEVEHDLRYKCTEDWNDHKDLGRALNGILASLETSDWGMSQIFEDLAYRHYKSSNWNGMLRNKFRLRITGTLSAELTRLFENDNNLAKKVFRVERATLLLKISESRIFIPITMDNLVFIVNYLFLNQQKITDLMPMLLTHKFNEHF
jgi:putative GTP pyrophosphokinase